MNKRTAPPALKTGDTIGIFAPSSIVEKSDIEKSTAYLEERGYKVFIHPQTYEQENQSAGTHLQKSLAFQGLWQRKDISAIWAAGGGNRCMHLLDTINFKHLHKSPKILIGFSDVTALLNTLYTKTGIPTIHGPVFKNLHKYQQFDHLIDLLSGTKTAYPVNKENILKKGTASGHLIGGNLSLFQYLPQTTENEEFWKNGVLFLEDCNEELSRIDRMLLHLRRLNVLENISALVLGQFTPMPETGKAFGYTLQDIINEHTEGLNIPILYDMPFGHTSPFYAMPIGTKAHINTEELVFELSESATAP